jgi:hypothetical protein
MKKIITIAVLSCMAIILFSQAPQKFNYQAVVRDSDGTPSGKSVSFQISILSGSESGAAVYTETQSATSNAQGIVALQIGGGTTSNDFSAIRWDTSSYYLKVEMDAAGGTNYALYSTSQLLSVPYALNAKTASNSTTLISAFQPSGCQTLDPFTTTFQKIGDMGTLTKSSSDTWLEINVQTFLWVESFATGCKSVLFQLRVDSTVTTIGNATCLIKTPDAIFPVSITGVFKDITAGNHVVSLWAKGIGNGGTKAMWDVGCFNSSKTNNVLIKEYY